MTTLEMEIALMQKLDFRANDIIIGSSWGLKFKGMKELHQCDIISLTRNNNSGYATEVEIKISKQDFLNDFNKTHNHEHKLIKYFYYAVPLKLKELALSMIPDRAGLFIISKKGKGYKIETIKKATKRLNAIKWTDEYRNKLLRLSSMRVFNLKKTILKLKKL